MGRKKQRTINEHDIYVIKSPFDASIYVWHCVHGNHYNAYKEHVRLRKYETRELFARAEHENTYPKMYLLDTVTDTAQGAYRHCVAWTRYFLDQKMQSLSYPCTQEYALELHPETQSIYDKINKYPLAQIISGSTVLVKNYTRRDKTAPPAPKTEIKITVSHADLAFIQETYNKIQETNRELIKTYKKYTNRLLKLLPK